MRKTKIIATIGPASESKEMLTQLIKTGVNVCRLNMSHDMHKNHQAKVNKIKEIRKKLNLPIGIMVDTKGPEIRIGTFESGKIFLKKGDEFCFVSKECKGNQNQVYLGIQEIFAQIKQNDKLLANDGLLGFKVKSVTKDKIVCKVQNDGALSDRKSLNIPSVSLKRPYLSEADKLDLKFAKENDVEYIAASFVSKKQDILDIKKYLGKESDIGIIAKIENQDGIDNIDEIIEVSDGIMIARGDMGIEIDLVKLPSVQKMIMKKCIEKGKIVITATEMLESMISNPRPTRAEVNDIANAIFDGTSAIMLSGETAMGKYPTECVKVMDKISKECEKKTKTIKDEDAVISSISDAIVHSTVEISNFICAKAIINFTHHGHSSKKLASFMPNVPVYSMTTNPKTYNQSSLLYGVYGCLNKKEVSTDDLFEFSEEFIKKQLNLKKNDKVVVTCGTPATTSFGTNTIRICNIK